MAGNVGGAFRRTRMGQVTQDADGIDDRPDDNGTRGCSVFSGLRWRGMGRALRFLLWFDRSGFFVHGLAVLEWPTGVLLHADDLFDRTGHLAWIGLVSLLF